MMSNAGCRQGMPSATTVAFADDGHLVARALFDWDICAGPRSKVHGAPRSGNGEGNLVLIGEHRQRVRPDLVCNVGIGCNAIAADDHEADLPRLEEVAGHVVGDHLDRDAVLMKLPCGEPRALQVWPRLVGQHANVLALGARRTDDAERSAIPAGGQSAGVAMCEDDRAIGNVGSAELTHAPTRRHVLAVNRFGLFEHTVVPRPGRELVDLSRLSRHPRDRPSKIDGGGPRRIENPSSGPVGHEKHLPVALLVPRDHRQRVRRRNANRGRPSDHHVANRIRDLIWLSVAVIPHLSGQEPLVEHHHLLGGGIELDRKPIGATQRCARKVRAHCSSNSRRRISLTAFGFAAPLVAFITCPTK